MTAKEIISQLESLGSESTKKILIKHGAREPFFGVKVGDLKPIQKKIKKNYELALELYESGISDAMYLAGLIADETKMTKADLQKWVENAYWYMISEYTVPWVAAESNFGFEIALEWIDSDSELICSAGWNTLSNLAAYKNDNELNLEKFSELLDYITDNIHKAENRVRYCMNNYIISVGSYILSLRQKAYSTSDKIGIVKVDMGGTSCKVPDAHIYIDKVLERNPDSKKKKTVRC
jgi:3-methyladenine DNA glycosylase AlkD